MVPAPSPLSWAERLYLPEVLRGIAVTTRHFVRNLALQDARFVRTYLNGARQPSLIVPGFTTTIQTAATVDEGGNFIDVRYGPLTRWRCTPGQPQTYPNCPAFGDWHLTGAGTGNTTPRNNGLAVPGITPTTDFDGQNRPNNVSAFDIGADEL